MTVAFAVPAGHPSRDWRVRLLQAHGVALDKDSLRKIAEDGQLDAAGLQQHFQNLGSDSYQEREKAQQILSAAGEQVLEFLDAQGPIGDPEVRRRAELIRRSLTSEVKSQEGLMVKFAARTLLEKPADPATGGQFYEWFGEESKDCRKGYRALVHEGAVTLEPYVSNGRLCIPGKHGGEEDQRLVLRSQKWPESDALDSPVRVSCLMGGSAGNAGTWHPGLCIGRVKALFHPDYPGGGFRFEQIDTHKVFRPNIHMGYTPQSNQMHRVEMQATRLPGKKVQFRVLITSPGNKRFQAVVEVDEEDAGPMDRVSLERSGRQGGSATFDDLVVKVGESP